MLGLAVVESVKVSDGGKSSLVYRTRLGFGRWRAAEIVEVGKGNRRRLQVSVEEEQVRSAFGWRVDRG